MWAYRPFFRDFSFFWGALKNQKQRSRPARDLAIFFFWRSASHGHSSTINSRMPGKPATSQSQNLTPFIFDKNSSASTFLLSSRSSPLNCAMNEIKKNYRGVSAQPTLIIIFLLLYIHFFKFFFFLRGAHALPWLWHSPIAFLSSPNMVRAAASKAVPPRIIISSHMTTDT